MQTVELLGCEAYCCSIVFPYHHASRLGTRIAVSSLSIAMDKHHKDLSMSLLRQTEDFEDALKNYSPSEIVGSILDRHFIKLQKIAEPYYDYGTRPVTASLFGTPHPSSSYGPVPHTPTTAFGDDTMSVLSSRHSISNAGSSSATSIARRGFSTRSVPPENLPRDSSFVTSPDADTALALDHAILGNLTNSARDRRPPIIAQNGQEKLWAIKRGKGVEISNQPSIATPGTVRSEQRPLSRTVNQAAQNEQTPSKRRKAGGSDVRNENISMFISASDAEDSSEEEFWIFETGDRSGDLDARKRVNRIIQEPKNKKTGQARRQSTISASDKDEIKILLDFNAWKQDEIIRKGEIGALDPKEIYHSLKQSIATDGEEDEDSSHTASQVTLMIVSLGSTEAIVDLKCIIESMRCVTQAVLVRPPVKVVDRENFEKLGREDLVKLYSKNLVELTQWVFESTSKGTPLENFQSRYSSTHLCQFIVAARDQLMRNKDEMNMEDAENWIYGMMIRKAYPKIPQYRKNQTGAKKRETPQFKDAVTTLRIKSQRGFRWLALREKFGVGIMALYYHSGLFSETARISIDDNNISEEEFNLLMNYLSQEENTHSAWLSVLCNLINAHIEQGAEGMLRLPELFLEKWEAKQITLCRERSDRLSMMCETLDDRLRCPGNKVTEKAWLGVDYNTHLVEWLKEVEKRGHKEIPEEAQL